MTLAVMIVAMLLDRWVAAPRHWLAQGAHYWAGVPLARLRAWPRLWSAVVLLLPLLLLALAVELLGRLHPLFSGVLGLLVLWLCLDFGALKARCQQGRRTLAGGGSPVEQGALGRQLPLLALDAMFGVGVWFVLAGPVGSLLYRLLVIYSEQAEEAGFQPLALWLHGLMAWLPAQLMLVGYTLVGRFDDARDAWRHHVDHDHVVTAGRLQAVAAAAQGLPEGQPDSVESLRDGWGLVRRQVFFLFTVIAVLTLVGVVG